MTAILNMCADHYALLPCNLCCYNSIYSVANHDTCNSLSAMFTSDGDSRNSLGAGERARWIETVLVSCLQVYQ